MFLPAARLGEQFLSIPQMVNFLWLWTVFVVHDRLFTSFEMGHGNLRPWTVFYVHEIWCKYALKKAKKGPEGGAKKPCKLA